MQPVGVSSGGAVPAAAPGVVVPPLSSPPSPIPVDYHTSYARFGTRFVSMGHAGRFDAEVFVTPSAGDVVLSPLAKIEPGVILVMDEFPRTRGGGPGVTLMMEKRAPGFDPAHGDWRYVVVDGTRIEDGPLRLCARCHDEAPHDHVFSTGP